ncbi:MAG: hypothetical protein Kow0062_06800 [Acidobacteriota bacterium]
MLRGKRLSVLATLVIVLAVAAWTSPALAKVTIKQKVGDKEFTLQLYGFSQLEARAGEGREGKPPGESGPRFSAQRIRVGFNYFHNGLFSKLFLDFNQSHSSDEAGLPKMIKDAFVGYRFNDAAFIRIGMIKAPVGMKFTIPGWNMDIVERNKLDKGMVLERDMGIMLSGRLIGGPADQKLSTSGIEMGHEKWGRGFGYDIGVFNPAGRSAAVTWDKSVLGDALAYAARIHYDHGLPLHFEASYGVSEQAGGPGTEDFKVLDIGINSFLVDGRLHWNAEYIDGKNILGIDGWDQDCLTVTLAWMFTPTIEGVVRHYAASVTRGDNPELPDTSLGNTYVGFNFYLKPLNPKHRTLQNHRIQFNYVLTSGDDDGAWTGKWGYQQEAWLLQWQIKY